jgi:YHS domain-containing protein
MLLRIVLEFVLLTIIGRTFWRMVDGLIEGMTGNPRRRSQQTSSRVPQAPASVQMKRDPVCGTFVLPDRAVTLTIGREPIFFCSAECRDSYRRQRPEAAAGRTA